MSTKLSFSINLLLISAAYLIASGFQSEMCALLLFYLRPRLLLMAQSCTLLLQLLLFAALRETSLSYASQVLGSLCFGYALVGGVLLWQVTKDSIPGAKISISYHISALFPKSFHLGVSNLVQIGRAHV